MIPRLGSKYRVEVETVARPREEYGTAEYMASGFPAAPALMVGDELLVQGRDIEEGEVEFVLRRRLGLPES